MKNLLHSSLMAATLMVAGTTSAMAAPDAVSPGRLSRADRQILTEQGRLRPREIRQDAPFREQEEEVIASRKREKHRVEGIGYPLDNEDLVNEG